MGPRPWRELAPALVAMLAVGPSNFVLYKMLFSSYGAASSVFVMQGINALYVAYGAVALALVHRAGGITPAMRALPLWPFAAMAALDCCGGLLAALGAAGTPGQLQTLLNQSLVPCTMAFSALFLGARYSARKMAGASVILLGAACVVLPSLLPWSFSAATVTPSGDAAAPVAAQAAQRSDCARGASVLLYWASNVPMALSAVYKESRFARRAGAVDVHVMYLTQWVSLFQFAFGFLVAPAQALPGVASLEGVPLKALALEFAKDAKGLLLLRGARERLRAALLVAYVAANFVLNVASLVVTKRGGAALSALLYSVLLPLSTLAFCLPFLGPFRERVQVSTLVGLAVVLTGFLYYESDDAFTPASPREKTASYESCATSPVVSPLAPTLLSRPPSSCEDGDEAREEVPAFHERLLLVHLPVKGSSRASLRRAASARGGDARAALATSPRATSPDLHYRAELPQFHRSASS